MLFHSTVRPWTMTIFTPLINIGKNPTSRMIFWGRRWQILQFPFFQSSLCLIFVVSVPWGFTRSSVTSWVISSSRSNGFDRAYKKGPPKTLPIKKTTNFSNKNRTGISFEAFFIVAMMIIVFAFIIRNCSRDSQHICLFQTLSLEFVQIQ